MKRREVILVERAVSEFSKIRRLWSKIPKNWQYYLVGLSLILLGFIIATSGSWSSFFIGVLIAGAGFYIYFLSFKLGRSNESNFFTSNYIGHNNIDTNGGDYSPFVNGDSIQGTHIEGDYIKGNYINVQGNYINIDQGFSQFSSQIQEILTHLKTQSSSQEEAENQVIQELNNQARKNPKFRKRLFKWKGALKALDNNTELVTERLFHQILEDSSGVDFSSSTPDDSIPIIEDKYQVLHEFLKNGKWKEADEETARVIYGLMPNKKYSYDRSLKFEEIPPRELRKINKLWVRYSQGRFGFSVQKELWEKACKICPHQEKGYGFGTYWKYEDAYLAFINYVGWSIHDHRLYYDDLNYSLTAPPGHLPARIMFNLSEIYYSKYSNYCDLNQEVFDDLMKRHYSDYSSIVPWLKSWFSID